MADDSRSVDFDPQAVLDDVRRLLGIQGEGGVSGKVDGSSDASSDDDSDANSSEGLGKLGGSFFIVQYCHSMYAVCTSMHDSVTFPHLTTSLLSCLVLHWALCRRGSRDGGRYG